MWPGRRDESQLERARKPSSAARKPSSALERPHKHKGPNMVYSTWYRTCCAVFQRSSATNLQGSAVHPTPQDSEVGINDMARAGERRADPRALGNEQ